MSLAIVWGWSRAEAGVTSPRIGPGEPIAAGPRDVELNGAPVQVTTASTVHEVPAALDRLARACAAGALEPEALGAALAGQRPVEAIDAAEVLRWDDGARGFVGCLGPDGGVRHVYAQRRGDRTTLAAIGSPARLDLARMFTERGDAPGADIPHMPRPPGLRRALSVRHGTWAMVVYRGRARAPDLRRVYRRAMPEHGWRFAAGSRDTLYAHRRGVSAAVSFGDEGDEAWVTVVQGQ